MVLHAIVTGKMVRESKGDGIYELRTLVVWMVLSVCPMQRRKRNRAWILTVPCHVNSLTSQCHAVTISGPGTALFNLTNVPGGSIDHN